MGTLTIAGGGGAPTGAFYWTGAADGTLTNEINLGALGTGLIINTAGTPSIYACTTCTNQDLRALTASKSGTCVTITSAYTSGTFPAVAHNILSSKHGDTLIDTVVRGDIIRGNSTPKWARLALGGNNLYLKSNATDLIYSTLAAGGVGSCTNQFVTALNADAAPTCTTATLASAQFANQGTTTTLLHGNAAGNPSFGSVVSADLNLTTTTCTNQFVTALSAGGVGTCTTDTLASAQHANQGTTTTVLHGNAAGNPSFGAVDLSADTTGTVPNTKGGTGQNSSAWSAIPLVTGGVWSQYGGVTCTNQVLTALTASAAGTCTTITSAYTSGTFSATAHNLLSATHGDTTAGTVARGDLLRGSATATWERLAKGGTNLYVKANATDLVYSTLAAGGVGSCTNQAVTALNADAAPTCTTITSAYVDSTIVPSARTISTTAPLSGGGDLTSNRTITTSMATNKLIGRGTAGTGVMEEITLGTNLSFTGTTLNAAGGSGYSTIEDEGTARTQRSTVNFTGAGVSCVDDGSSKTVCTISGGGVGSANVTEVSLSLGTEMGLYYTTTVTGQAWVTSSSVIACSMFGTTADGQTPETIAVAGIVPTVSDRVAGTGFNLNVYNPNGATGTIRAHCTGA